MTLRFTFYFDLSDSNRIAIREQASGIGSGMDESRSESNRLEAPV